MRNKTTIAKPLNNINAIVLTIALALGFLFPVTAFSQSFRVVSMGGRSQSVTTNLNQPAQTSADTNLDGAGGLRTASTTTTISVQDENGPVARARVTVFDARNGRQIVNGLTDTGQLTFRSSKRRELIVVVFTSSRFLGTARVMSGRSAVVVANQDPETVPLINDPLKTGDLTFTDEEGAPIADANITLIGTRSFDSADRGGTDEQGRFSFRVPEDPTELAYLATLWTEDGEISLVGILTFAGRPQSALWMPSFL